jgi:uncharacterized protein with von Willebrand factor type A (vWA) domain
VDRHRGTSPTAPTATIPKGVRIGQDGNRNFRAVKVWDRREFKDFDDEVELGVRNMRVALRRLAPLRPHRARPRSSTSTGTIRETASRAIST